MKQALIAFVAVFAAAATVSAAPLTCKEGSTAYFQEPTSNGRWVQVLRTCHDGRFYPKTEVAPLTCKEGSTAYFQEALPNGDWTQVLRTCHNGRFYPKSEPVIIRCKEGSISSFLERTADGDHFQNVWKKCVNGKYVTTSLN